MYISIYSVCLPEHSLSTRVQCLCGDAKWVLSFGVEHQYDSYICMYAYICMFILIYLHSCMCVYVYT